MARMPLLAVLLASAAPAASCEVADPVHLARWIYDGHRNVFFEDKVAPNFLSDRLQWLLNREIRCRLRELCALDQDPWTQSQDGHVAGHPTFALSRQTSDRAVVRMDFRFTLEDDDSSAASYASKLIFVLDPRTHCWRLDDVRGRENYSLKRMLEKYPFYGT